METVNIEKVEKFLELLGEGNASQTEVAEAIEAVLGVIAQLKVDLEQNIAINKGQNDEELEALKDNLKEVEGRLGRLIISNKEANKEELNKVVKQFYAEVKRIEELIPAPTDLSSIEARLNVLEAPEPEEPDDPYEARNELEAIDNESEKLSIDAIKDLRKELDEIKKQKGGTTIFGGGFNYSAMSLHIVDDETPSGAINGSNTVFTLANVPSPASSLKVYLNGARQRITEDYTLSGGTITFTIAPPTGSILLADYRN